MRFFFSKSIRTQLIFLILICILPALGVFIYTGLNRLNTDVTEAHHEAMRVLQSLAYDHEHTVESTKQFLMTLASLPDVQNQNASACNKLFRDLHKKNKVYSTILAANADGMVFANALPFTPYSVKQKKYFQDSLRTREFSAGEDMIGIASGRQSLSFAYPVMDSKDQIQAVVGVGIDLDRYGQVFTKTKLPEDSVFVIFDHRNIRLYRSYNAADYIGKADSPEMIKYMTAQPEEGIFTGFGPDGIKRLYAYKRFYLKGSTSPYLFMRVGIAKEKALANARKTLLINLALLCSALIVTMVIAWFLGKAIIIDRLYRLLDTSQRLGRGDLTARTGLEHGKDELGQVTKAFDEMAGELEHRESERKYMEEEIRALAITDPLTGLYNRRGFITLAEQQLKIAERTKNRLLLLFADLDHMKWINDHLGHVKGDEALIEAADVFKEVFREADIFARVGGDEFAVLALGSTMENSDILKDRLQQQISIHNNRENRNYDLSISIGMVYSDSQSPSSLDELMSRADALMYEDKKRKKL